MTAPFRSICCAAMFWILLVPAIGLSTGGQAQTLDEKPLEYSIVGAGALLLWSGIFAGTQGTNPCSDPRYAERHGGNTRDCYDSQKKRNGDAARFRTALLGGGAVTLTLGLWLLKRNPTAQINNAAAGAGKFRSTGNYATNAVFSLVHEKSSFILEMKTAF